MSYSKHIGVKGEELALHYLKGLKYQILAQNYRYSRAEIDIIAKDSNGLVFIEVKTRSSDNYNKPEDSVSPRKQKLIFSAAQNYMEKNNYNWEIRFDIISILLKDNVEFQDYEINHLKDVYH